MLFDFNNYLIFLLVCCRMMGSILFNPIFGRQTVPGMVKMGLAVGLAYYAATLIEGVYVEDFTAPMLILCMVKEFAVGFALGHIMKTFLAIFSVSGYVIDMQIGYSMATLYDASSNAQISVTGNLMTLMYSILFFITNSHLNLIMIIIASYNVLPIGSPVLNREIGVYMIQMFGYMFVYALQLAIPFIVLEIITEVAVGMLMKMVPNINVFVINLHLKMAVGMIIIMTVIPALVEFMTRITLIMIERMEGALPYMAL